MKFCIIAPTYTNDPSMYRYLTDSCRRCGHELITYGNGEYWPGYVKGKIVRLREELRKLDHDFVMVVDGYDTFLSRPMLGAEHLATLLSILGGRVLIAAEVSCYPVEGLIDKFPPTITPYRYVNAGGFVGHREDVMEVLSQLLTYESGDDDQARWSYALVDGLEGVVIDSRCRVFQSMAGAATHMKLDSGRRIKNIMTGSSPVVAHFNGRSGGIEEWYLAVWGV